MLLCDLEHRICGEAASRPFDLRSKVDRKWLRDLLFCLDQIIDHNAFEEAELFPLVCAHGDRELAALLMDEHDAIGPQVKHLHAITVGIIENGINAQRWHDFKAVASDLIPEMMFHLQKEEMAVVQRLAVFLDARADHQLALMHVAERPPIRSQEQPAAGVYCHPDR
jgi:hypothetical protein